MNQSYKTLSVQMKNFKFLVKSDLKDLRVACNISLLATCLLTVEEKQRFHCDHLNKLKTMKQNLREYYGLH